MSDVQGSMFPDLVSETVVVPRETSPVADPVPRPPGWVLVAARGGPQGFHRVQTVNEYNSVYTVCGLKGHLIRESERAIVLCPICEAEFPVSR